MKKTAQKTKKKISAEQLRRRLKLKHLETKKKLSEVHPHVEKFFKTKGIDPGKIRTHSAKIIGAGAIAGAMLLKPHANIKALPAPHKVVEKLKVYGAATTTETKLTRELFVDTLKSVLPIQPRPLGRSEEKFLEQIFQNATGVKTRATLEGEHLNTTFGYIGAEQHLNRFPGDSIAQHAPPDDFMFEKRDVLKEGIAPGLGAWGYFAPTKEKLTPDLEETEKWYAVVQTLYLPDWNVRTRYLREWYKYRKVLIVNTDNGHAVVASIADSGPAAWTGKHFGGSPEVMNHLGGARYKKGPVVLFFVDDPENKVPLGPVDYNKISTDQLVN